MPLLETKGAGSAQGFGLTSGGKQDIYIEDVFSTYLYTGNGSTQTINNGIDLTGKGGMVWTKSRSATNESNILIDTTRGVRNYLTTNTTNAQINGAAGFFLTQFNSNGYVYSQGDGNQSGFTYASWTFRKAPKFFDVVTFTSDSSGNATFSHGLSQLPGMVIVKRTDSATAGNWAVYHRSLGYTKQLQLNLTNAESATAIVSGSTSSSISCVNLAASAQHVAYLFAHNAGGFGLTGTDNVISCGSFTTDGNGAGSITLGYEPQFLLMKTASTTGDWVLVDNMRGLPNGGSTNWPTLNPHTSGVEGTYTTSGKGPTATGVDIAGWWPSATSIYIAIRRGPMKTPTSGTQVFSPLTFTGSTNTVRTTGFPIDLQIIENRGGTFGAIWSDRLRGVATIQTASATPVLRSAANDAEDTGSYAATNRFGSTGFSDPAYLNGISGVYWSFRRAPGFFDVVCYTGTGVARTVNHNLGVAPELMIVKARNGNYFWPVWCSAFPITQRLQLEEASALAAQDLFNGTLPTSSVFYLSAAAGTSAVNQNPSYGSIDYVAYLFASCHGVSKIGTYTGTGTTQQINCGFAAGARFVLIKRTDSTGGWYIWDSARGIVAGNDPYLLLNSTAAEVTTTDYIDTYSAGFEISSTAPAEINANGGTYIYLAIA